MTHNAIRTTKYHGHGKVYAVVWTLLLVLTAITVSVSYYNFGDINILVAMLVATIKGALVCLYFMHLRYDHYTYPVVFLSAFFFLGIFVGLTASDELFRKTERVPMIAAAEAKPSGAEMGTFLKSTPELLTKGKEIYAMQCAVCHGVEGKGDGPGAAALNPKPRDFTSGYWRFGGGPAGVFKTITEGSPGTSMAAFGNLTIQERFALAHTVRSFGPQPLAEDKQEDLTALEIGAGSSGVAFTETKPQYKIPISFAIEQVAQEEADWVDRADISQGRGETSLVGGRLYQTHCLSCHGLNGKGGIPIKQISTNPPVYLKTKTFVAAQGDWVNDQAKFVERVSKGLPGSGKPGIAGFTNEEWQALYQYVLSLMGTQYLIQN